LGPFLVGTSVRTDVSAPAIIEILNEIESMRRSEPTCDELLRAKESLARSLPGMFETTSQAASTIGQLFVHHLAEDYYRTLPNSIDAVASSEVRRVAAKYLQPENVIIVAAGDRAKIERDLRDLKLGPVEIRDLEGNPLDPASE
jgi:zinc protease